MPFARTGVSQLVAAVCACTIAAAHAAARQDSDLPPLPPEPQVGQPAPALSVEQVVRTGSLGSADPSALDLSALRGKVIVIEFWATWCAPCIGAISHLNDLAAAYRDKPVVFVSITDETAEPVEKFLARREIDGVVALDTDRSVFLNYRTAARPQTIIIDAAGIYRANIHPVQLTSELLDAALAGRDLNDVLNAPKSQPLLTASTQVIEAPSDTASAPVGQESSAGMVGPSSPQTQAGEVLFEISLRASEQTRGRIEKWENRLIARGCTARDLVAECVQASPGQVISDDAFELDAVRYDATISFPPGMQFTDASGRSGVVGALNELVERAIGLQASRERRIIPVLVVRPAPESSFVNIRDVSSTQGASSLSWGLGTISAIRQPMQVLAERLSAMLRMPVIDETGLTGVYDWTVKCADDSLDAVGAALQEQLGLRAEVQTRQMDVVVVRRTR